LKVGHISARSPKDIHTTGYWIIEMFIIDGGNVLGFCTEKELLVIVFSQQGNVQIYPVGPDIPDIKIMKVVVVNIALNLQTKKFKTAVPGNTYVLHI
jgi:hypothetical protein